MTHSSDGRKDDHDRAKNPGGPRNPDGAVNPGGPTNPGSPAYPGGPVYTGPGSPTGPGVPGGQAPGGQAPGSRGADGSQRSVYQPPAPGAPGYQPASPGTPGYQPHGSGYSASGDSASGYAGPGYTGTPGYAGAPGASGTPNASATPGASGGEGYSSYPGVSNGDASNLGDREHRASGAPARERQRYTRNDFAEETEAEPEAERIARTQSLGEIFSRFTTDLSTLLRQEIALAKAEATDSAKKAGTGIGMFVGAAIGAVLLLLFLSMALMWALGSVMHLGWAALIVAAVWAIVAAVLALLGKNYFDKIRGLPQTQETVQQIPPTLNPSKETP